MEYFKLLSRAGIGAHGLVFRALDLRNGEIVALKQIEVNISNGLPNNTLREICAMRQLKSKYIVELKEVSSVGSAVLLVMEYLKCSLADILRNLEHALATSQIKMYAKMLFLGLKVMHINKIMHRDLKPANLLINEAGILKIADFGLARIYNMDKKRQYSHQVATRWYRAPELLYGSRNYTPAIDMWAAGCIIAEMINNQPLFPGETDIEQLAIVLSTLGTPNEEIWPGLSDLPDYNKISFAASPGKPWNVIIPNSDATILSFIQNLLQYDYNKRLRVEEALNHPFFFEKPLPCEISQMPKLLEKSEKILQLEDFDEIFN